MLYFKLNPSDIDKGIQATMYFNGSPWTGNINDVPDYKDREVLIDLSDIDNDWDSSDQNN